MIISDFHVHTDFDDGKNTVREMIEAAIEKGVNLLGIVCHSELDNIEDNSWCLKKKDYAKFIDTVGEIREEYREQICVLIGLEQDYYSPEPDIPFDFIIGSVHVLEKDGKFYSFDASEEEFCKVRDEVFGGDMEAMYKCYYQTLSHINENVRCNIIGHFDLIGKFNDKYKYFNETSQSYEDAFKQCVDKIIEQDEQVKFEINTGCIYRGARGRVYPCINALEYIMAKGAEVVLSSDAHDVDGIAYGFEGFIDDDVDRALKEIGDDDDDEYQEG